MAQSFLQTVSEAVSSTALDDHYPAPVYVSGDEGDIRPPNVNPGRPEQTQFPPQPGGQIQGVRTLFYFTCTLQSKTLRLLVIGSGVAVTVVTSQPQPSLNPGTQG